MKQLLVFIFLASSLFVSAQNKYRFAVGGGFHSMMFWGLRDFEDVVCPQSSDYSKLYENESYTLNYKNFQFSNQYTLNFGVNWIAKSDFEISQNFSFYKGKFTDEIENTLTSHSGAPGSYYDTNFNATNVFIGAQGTVYSDREFGGIRSTISLRKSVAKNFWLGSGIGINFIQMSDELWHKSNGYSPMIGLSRGRRVDKTTQLVIAASVVYRLNFVEFYFSLTQGFVALSRIQKNPVESWHDGSEVLPVCHNLDYRFPLTFETGITLSFDRIKK